MEFYVVLYEHDAVFVVELMTGILRAMILRIPPNIQRLKNELTLF